LELKGYRTILVGTPGIQDNTGWNSRDTGQYWFATSKIKDNEGWDFRNTGKCWLRLQGHGTIRVGTSRTHDNTGCDFKDTGQ
jgi:hypothetical protein